MMLPNSQDAWTHRKKSLVLQDGRRQAYVDTGGANPPLVLLHGFTDSSRSFEPMLPMLDRFRLIIPDLRGHGGSSAGPGWTIADFADDVETLLNSLQLSSFSLIGHSMGAMTALKMASGRPLQVEKLVLISGSLRPRFSPESDVIASISALFDPINPDSAFMCDWHACATMVDPEFLSKMRREAAYIPAIQWQSILKELQVTDLTSIARNVTTPALCVGGSLDPLFDETHLQDMCTTLPDCQSALLIGHGHNPHWEDAGHIASMINGFLKTRQG